MSMIKSKKIALIQGGNNSEKQISYLTAKSIKKALDELKYSYVELEADESLPTNLKNSGADIAFLAVHGKLLEDGPLQGLLEYLGISYTGSNFLACSACMNKVFFKKTLKMHNILTPDFFTLTKHDFLNNSLSWFPKNYSFPLIIKPARGGSSRGVFIVHSIDELIQKVPQVFEFDSQVLVEKYIEGFDLTLPWFNNQFLPFVEICPKKGFYNYENKYTTGNTDYFILEKGSSHLKKYPEQVLERCREEFKKIISYFGIQQLARADFIITKNYEQIHWLEVNLLPGFTDLSLITQAGSCVGLNTTKMVEILIDTCHQSS